jgi:hypothetical protein
MAICLPQNVYGPFDQTQFLGCSVLSFTANAGINEQGSELTVELVQDLCVGERIYFKTEQASNAWNPNTHIEADPGFTEPIVGAPCYFRVADFEFAGLMQSWTKKKGSDGNPTYTVKLTDPRILLDNIQIILSDYQGGFQLDPIFPDRTLVNIINVYGFLDSLVQNCPLVEIHDDEVFFGALAGGWGYSSGNKSGVPWNLIKDAVLVLLGNNTSSQAPKFSKGWIYGPPGSIRTADNRGGYGEIYTGGSFGGTNPNPAKYILDLTEIPYGPLHYRISGPIISVSELISQACRDAGCDYYVELLPTATALVIKVRVIVRRVQPAMNEIKQFITTASILVGTTDNTIGKEYRPNPNNAFIIGDKVRSVYRHSGSFGGAPTTGALRSIQPYWGRDMDGLLNIAYESTCENTDIANSGHWLGPPDWNVRLDFRELQGLLSHKMSDDNVNPITGEPWKAWEKLMPHGKGWVLEGELRAALGSMQDFINFLLMPAPYCTSGTSTEDEGTVLRLWAIDLNLAYQAAVPSKLANGTATMPLGSQAAKAGDTTVFLSAINAMVGSKTPAGPGSVVLRDVQKVHQWLQSYAQEHYGRKWLVEIPFTCWAGDTGNPKKIRWTDEPSPEGGWTDAEDILDLVAMGNNDLAINNFKSDDGRLLPILRWTMNRPYDNNIPCGRNPCMTGLDYSRVPSSQMVTNLADFQPTQGPDLYVWQKAELDDTWVTGSPYLGSNQYRAFALLTCDPITTGFPINDGKRAPDVFIVRSGVRDLPVGSNKGPPMVGIAGRYGDRMIHPLAAAVPILSNTQTYGPWYKQAPMANANDSYGTVYAEQDTTLNPWEYGGTKFMNSGAFSKLENATTIMNIAERGEVTVAGYPTMGLGAGITSTVTLANARNLLTNGVFNLQYHYVKLPVSHAGASVANMNVVVSPQGVTTAYTMTTFTPVFGRFSKNNAERIKQIGTNKLRAERELTKKMGGRGGSTSQSRGAASRAYVQLSAIEAGSAYAPNSAGIFLAGRLAKHDERRKEVIIADKNTFAFYGDYTNTALMSIDGLLRPVSKTGALDPGRWFDYTIPGLPAMKSYTDTLCPYTGLPGVIHDPYENEVFTGSVSGGFVYSGYPTGVKYKNLYSPIAPPPPIPHSSGIIVAASYLDPLADYISNSGFMTLMRATGALGTGTGGGGYPYASGHDIESVARGDLTGLGRLDVGLWSGESMIIAGEDGRYDVGTTDNLGTPQESGSGNYRFMALRGPLVLQSWGYDTYGRPIPNAKGWSGDKSYDTGAGTQVQQMADFRNVHQRGQSGLTDRFAPNWLANATNWPVAPVDLRFDRARGVWTTPPPFRLQRVIALADFEAGETGIVELLTGGDIYNEDGLEFKDVPFVTGSGDIGGGVQGLLYATGIPKIFNLVHIADISSGDIMVTHYDTYSCEHWVVGGVSSGGGGGFNGDVPGIGDFVCEGDIITTSTYTMTFSNGLLVSTG